MKRMHMITGTCALIIIAFVLLAGCTFLQGGKPPVQPATPGIITTIPTTPDTRQTPVKEVSQTCPEIGGNICLTDETCTGSLIKTTDSSRCCAGTCTITLYTITPSQTNTGVTPTSTVTLQPTQTNPSVTPTSEYITPQQTNPGVTPTSIVAVQPQQTYEAEVSQTCLEIGGNPCLSDETCTGSLIKTTDSFRCCAGTCTISSYATSTPTPTPTQVFVPKTCVDFGGLICQATETCKGALVQTTDSSKCCAGTCITT